MWIELETSRQQATACYRLVQSDTGLKNKMPSHILHGVYPQVKHTCSFPRFGVLVLLRTCVVSNGPNLISLSFFQSKKYWC